MCHCEKPNNHKNNSILDFDSLIFICSPPPLTHFQKIGSRSINFYRKLKPFAPKIHNRKRDGVGWWRWGAQLLIEQRFHVFLINKMKTINQNHLKYSKRLTPSISSSFIVAAAWGGFYSSI
jgi:hypothetical protein